MGAAACKPLWTYWLGKKDVRILFLGLDASGKTTTLYKLKLGQIVTTIPTIGFNVETLEHNNVRLTAWDVGCRDKTRPLMRHYYANTQALVFVIDSVDKERFNELLDDVMKPTLQEDELYNIPCLILANKQDLPSAMTPDEVAKALHEQGYLKDRKWAVFGTSAISEADGLQGALEWLTDVLMNKEKDDYMNGIVETWPTPAGGSHKLDKSKEKDPSKWTYFSQGLDIRKWLGWDQK